MATVEDGKGVPVPEDRWEAESVPRRRTPWLVLGALAAVVAVAILVPGQRLRLDP